jgi:hypothetical protein
MSKKLILILILITPLTVFAQEEAVTSDGKVVLLFPDSTWRYKVQVTDSVGMDSTAYANGEMDSVATPAPKQNKVYSDIATGFRGFLKPKLNLPPLPEQWEGTYAFRVKVNKEGFVKEVVTTLRGPNGQAEAVMRNTITKMKFMPDGSVVAPLTEGVIQISVPEGK